MSPIDVLSGQLFFVHMIQHLLLIMIAPPLLLLPNPMATMLWGLPTPLRYRVGDLIGRLLHRQSRVRHGLRAVTKPGFIWMFAVIAILGWHDPNAYNAALRDDFIHDLEHLCFFAAGMFSFWHITGAGPRIHKRSGLIGRIAFAIAAVPPNMLTGVVIAFATTPIYSHYTTVPRLWGISVLTDQQLAGIIMWIPGSMMYFMIALVLIARLLQGEARKPALPQAAWATDETLLASGLEQ